MKKWSHLSSALLVATLMAGCADGEPAADAEATEDTATEKTDDSQAASQPADDTEQADEDTSNESEAADSEEESDASGELGSFTHTYSSLEEHVLNEYAPLGEDNEHVRKITYYAFQLEDESDLNVVDYEVTPSNYDDMARGEFSLPVLLRAYDNRAADDYDFTYPTDESVQEEVYFIPFYEHYSEPDNAPHYNSQGEFDFDYDLILEPELIDWAFVELAHSEPRDVRWIGYYPKDTYLYEDVMETHRAWLLEAEEGLHYPDEDDNSPTYYEFEIEEVTIDGAEYLRRTRHTLIYEEDES